MLKRLVYLLLTIPFAIWGVLSLWFGSWPMWVCIALAVFYGTAFVLTICIAPSRRVLYILIGIFMVPLFSFILMQPSHDRNWQPDVKVLPYAKREGNKVEVHNIRNNVYRSETEYDTNFETRTYDLDKLQSMDVLLTDWGLKHVVHTMVSFGFEGGKYLCFSVEARKEAGESYSTVRGFFRQYELIFVLADERDLVGLRTNIRKGEEVYLYRLRGHSLENLRATFLSFVDKINELHARPKWYNALYDNCMTSAFRIARKHAVEGRGDWHWSIILNGHSPRRAYDKGLLDTSLPFNDLQRKSIVNDRARAIGTATADFSVQIREGLPGIDYVTPAAEQQL